MLEIIASIVASALGGLLVNYISHHFIDPSRPLGAETADQKQVIPRGRRDWRLISLVGALSGLAWSLAGTVWWYLDSEAGPLAALLIGGILQAIILSAVAGRLTWAGIAISGILWTVAGTVGGVFGTTLMILVSLIVSNNMMDADLMLNDFLGSFMWGGGLLFGGMAQLMLLRKSLVGASKLVMCFALVGWLGAGAVHGFLDIKLGISLSGQISGAAHDFSVALEGKSSSEIRKLRASRVRRQKAISLIPGMFFVGLLGAGAMMATLTPYLPRTSMKADSTGTEGQPAPNQAPEADT